MSKRGNGSSDVSYIAIGIAIGVALGVALDNIAIGIALEKTEKAEGEDRGTGTLSNLVIVQL